MIKIEITKNIKNKTWKIIKTMFKRFQAFVLSLLMLFASFDIPSFATPTVWEYSYEDIGNSYTSWEALETGVYKLEVWGASGGGCTSASGNFSGGYTYATVNIMQGDKLYIYCGQEGSASNPSGNNRTYGQGGAGLPSDLYGSSYCYNGSGGGATSIRTSGGEYSSTMSTLLVVAGGGAGAHYGTECPGWAPEKTKGNAASGGTFTGSNSCIASKHPSGSSGITLGGCGGGYTLSLTSDNTSYGNGGSPMNNPPYFGGDGFVATTVNTYGISMGGNLGNGKAKITYVGKIQSSIEFKCESGGTYDGVGDSSGSATVTRDYGDTITFLAPVRPGWTFRYWTNLADTSLNPTKYYAGDSYTFTLEDQHFVAHYIYDGNAKFYQTEPTVDTQGKIHHYIHVDNIDDGIEKTVKFTSSSDNGATWDSVNANGASFNLADTNFNLAYSGSVVTIPIKATGYYNLDICGGSGGQTTGYGLNYYNSTIGDKGFTGTTLKGKVKLNYGDTLYITIGGKGSGSNAGYGGNAPGGAGGHYSYYWNYISPSSWNSNTGGGGGATTIYLNSPAYARNSILACAGGGAGSGGCATGYCWHYQTNNCGPWILYYGGAAQTDSNAFGGSSHPLTTLYGRTSTMAGETSIPNNTSEPRRSGGGGGGGYYGGSTTNGRPGVPKHGGFSGLSYFNESRFLAGSVIHNGSTPFNTSYTLSGCSNGANDSQNIYQDGYAKLSFDNTVVDVLAVDADFEVFPYDILAPDIPDNFLVTGSGTDLYLNWDPSKDNGNIYLYKAELDDADTKAKLYDCEDKNAPGNTEISVNAKSGTKGYYYYIDTQLAASDLASALKNAESSGQSLTGTNVIPGKEVFFTWMPQFYLGEITSDKYVHICAIDHSFNASNTATYKVSPGYTIAVNPNGGMYKGSTSTVNEFGHFSSPTAVPNPTRDGFTFIGWDAEGMDTTKHYYDSVLATTSSAYIQSETTYSDVFTSEIKSFMGLRATPGVVSFKAAWKDMSAPVISNFSYVNKEDGSNPDGTLYISYTTPDGSTYTPGTWTNKTILASFNAWDPTGFSNVSWDLNASVVVHNGNEDPVHINETAAAHSITYSYLDNAYGHSSNVNITTADLPKNSGILITSNIEEIANAQTPSSASTLSTSAKFTHSGTYGGTLSISDNAGSSSYFSKIRNWGTYVQNNTVEVSYGQVLIDKEVPVATVSYSETNWTNEDVVVTVTASDRLSGLPTNAYSWDNGATWVSDNTKTFSEMTAGYVYIRDSVGNWTKAGYKVGNIDKYEPWTNDIYHIHSTQSELHEWVNTPGGVTFTYTSKDIKDPGSASVSSGISQMMLYEANESFDKGSLLETVVAPFVAPSMGEELGEDLSSYVFTGDSTPLSLTFTDAIQGTRNFVLETYDRAGNVTTVELTYKWDVTPPSISDPYVHQTSLDEFNEDEVEDAIKGDLYCYFNYLLDDTNKGTSYTYENDSSGIDEVVLVLINAENSSEHREIKFSAGEIGFLTKWTSKNTGNEVEMELTRNALKCETSPSPSVAADEDAILKGYIGSKINTYEAFPDWAALNWVIYAVDRAGNSTNDSYTSISNIAGEEIKNFSIKTVIYSDEIFDNGASLNIKDVDPLHSMEPNYKNNVAYFRTGDVGHTKTWTVGYVDKFYTDFGAVGNAQAADIADGKLLVKYNLGEETAAFKRNYLCSIGTPIASGRPNNAAGVPYATVYETEGWWDYNTKNSDGTSVRISPYYKLEVDPISKKPDGLPKYKSETHTYNAVAKRGDWVDKSQGFYVIFDTAASEIHYRVTHEHHGSVSSSISY